MTLNTQNSLLIQFEEVTKVYQMGDVEVRALRGISFSMHEGEYVAIMGATLAAQINRGEAPHSFLLIC